MEVVINTQQDRCKLIHAIVSAPVGAVIEINIDRSGVKVCRRRKRPLRKSIFQQDGREGLKKYDYANGARLN